MSAITERRDMGLYEVPLSVSLLSVGIGTMLANFHVRGIMFLLKTLCKEKKYYFYFYIDNILIKTSSI